MGEVMNNFKIYRKKQKLTQAKMAELLHVTRQNYINYENGTYEPNFDTLIKISQILNTPIDCLLNNNIGTLSNTDFECIKKAVAILERLSKKD